MPALVVFGGNGFVGSRVCQEALKTGLAVISVNRSGAPKQGGAWVNEVQWVKVRLQHVFQHHADNVVVGRPAAHAEDYTL